MNSNSSLKDRCKVVNKKDKNSFVGIKGDTSDVLVYFPVGYKLSDTDSEIRKDILNLFNILNEFKNKREGKLSQKNFDAVEKVEFPLNAYLEIIYYYIEYGYYKEVDKIYKTKKRGKISWSKTIKQQNSLIYFNKHEKKYSPIYTTFTVKNSTLTEDKEITLIHQHCVYESFKKIGWIFTSYVPPKPQGRFNKNKFLTVLNDKLVNTNNDKKKNLFKSMIDMINFMDENGKEQFYFGTERFEYVFEGLIDKAFGIKNKERYFPKTKWYLQYNDNINKHALEPDIIMIYNNNIYIIDAKYYKYGTTCNPFDLPESTSINKQITYGEYVYKLEKDNVENIYNAFLMPYDMKNNHFKLNELFLNIGEATSEWKNNNHKFEHIQGILIDIKCLMHNYKISSKTKNIEKLANAIEKAYEKNKKY